MRGEAPKRKKFMPAAPQGNQPPVQEMKRGKLKPIGVAKALSPKAIKINAQWVKAHAAEAAKPIPANMIRKPRTMERVGIPRVSKGYLEPGTELDMGNFILKGKSRGTDGKFR